MALRYNTVTGAFEDDGLAAQGVPPPSGSWDFSAPRSASVPAPAPVPEHNPFAGSFGIVQQPIQGAPETMQAERVMDGQTFAQGGGVGVDLTQPQNLGAGANLQPEQGKGPGLDDFLALANQGGGGGGGPRVSQTIRQEMPMAPQTPEQRAAQDSIAQDRAEIEAKQREAQEGLKDVTADREALKLKESAEYFDRIQEHEQELARRQEDMQFVAKGMEERIKRDREEVNSAKVDPDAFWQEKGTLGRVLGAIAIGMGQFGASMTGSRNAALDIVNDAINRNVQAQLENIQNKKAKLADSRDAYTQNLTLQQQIDQKGMALRDQMYTDYIRRLDAQLGVTEEQEARSKLELLITDAESARNASAQEALQKQLGTMVVERKQVSGGGGGGQSGIKKLKGIQEAIKTKKAYDEVTNPQTDQKSDKTLVPNVGHASSEKGAQNTMQTIQYAAQGIAGLNKLKEYSEGEKGGFGSTIMSYVPGGSAVSEDVGTAQSLQTDVAINLAKAKDPASVVRESEMAMSLRQIPDPTKIGKGAATAKYNAQIDELRRRVRSSAAANGLDPDAAEAQLDQALDKVQGGGSQGYGFGQ